ncbi:MAG: methyltransferase domain-containing protein [Candidatus Hodarchaeales archaeon]
MNWLGDIEQKDIREEDTVLNLGCGIMQGILDHIETYPKTRLKCKKITGVDWYQPSIDYLNENYPEIDTLKWDLTKFPLPYADKSFDVVLLNDILEHLPEMWMAHELIREAERIARRFVFILTPSVFFDNQKGVQNAWGLGKNESNRHHILIDRGFLEKTLGYEVKILYKIHLFAKKRLFKRILHVNDQAGVSGLLVKLQREKHHEVRYVVHGGYDPMGICSFYGAEYYETTKGTGGFLNKIQRLYSWIRNLRKIASEFKPDIVHINSNWWFPFIFLLESKLIMFHGSELRDKFNDGLKNPYKKVPDWVFKIYRKLGVAVFVSTVDLMMDLHGKDIESSWFLPTCPDVEHFKKKTERDKSKQPKALYVQNWYEYPREAISVAKLNNWNLDIQSRTVGETTQFKDYPEFLKKYDLYIDRYNIGSMSKTALECLAMGIPVYFENSIIKSLPDIHVPEHVVERSLTLYDLVINS